MILREVERIAREKGCRVVTLGTASFMARPLYEKRGTRTSIRVPRFSGLLTGQIIGFYGSLVLLKSLEQAAFHLNQLQPLAKIPQLRVAFSPKSPYIG